MAVIRWPDYWPNASRSMPKMRDCRCNRRSGRPPICGCCEFRWRRPIRGLRLTDVAALSGSARGEKKAAPSKILYAAEQALLATERVIPLFHLPVSYAAAANLKDWTLRSDGGWTLADAWIGNGKP